MHPCQIPLGFDVEAFVRNALVVIVGGAQIEVELRFDRKTSAWAKDRIWHPSQKATLDSKGCLTLVLQVADTPTRGHVAWSKHGVSFEKATVFADSNVLDWEDLAYSESEKRFKRLGLSIGRRVLIVVYTFRRTADDNETIRIISARQASRKERKAYSG